MTADMNHNVRSLRRATEKAIKDVSEMMDRGSATMQKMQADLLKDLNELKDALFGENGDLDRLATKHEEQIFNQANKVISEIQAQLEETGKVTQEVLDQLKCESANIQKTIKEATTDLTNESKEWRNRYDNALTCLSRAKKEFSNSARQSFFQTLVVELPGKISHNITLKLGYSENVANVSEVVVGGAASMAYRYVYRLDATLLMLATQLISPLAQRGLKAAGYDPTTAISLAVAIKTAVEMYANPIEGTANLAGTLCGNAAGAAFSKWSAEALFGLYNGTSSDAEEKSQSPRT